jgi:hypothetical protein
MHPGNLTILVFINYFLVPKIIIDLGTTINITTLQTMEKLYLFNLLPTPIVLELADRSKINHEGD